MESMHAEMVRDRNSTVELEIVLKLFRPAACCFRQEQDTAIRVVFNGPLWTLKAYRLTLFKEIYVTKHWISSLATQKTPNLT
jgi:hypothetical protein